MALITVTKEHIRHGEGRSCRGCPIALAINDALPQLGYKNHYAYVEPHGGWFSDPVGIEIRPRYGTDAVVSIPIEDLPESVTQFAWNFDDWFDVQEEGWRAFKKRTGNDYPPDKPMPFTFEITL